MKGAWRLAHTIWLMHHICLHAFENSVNRAAESSLELTIHRALACVTPAFLRRATDTCMQMVFTCGVGQVRVYIAQIT